MKEVHVIQRLKVFAFTFMTLGLAQRLLADDGSQAQSSVVGYAWKIVNGIAGLSAVIIVGNIAWHARDMELYGKQVKSGFLSLVLLGALYGIVAWILNAGGAQNTTVSGVTQAISMKP